MRNPNCCCSCHCHCYYCPYYQVNNTQEEKPQSTQQNINYTTNNFASTADKTNFSNNFKYTYVYNPNNTTPIFQNDINDNSLNQNKNQKFTKTINYDDNNILNNESKIGNTKSINTSPKFDKNLTLDKKNNLNNRKTTLFNSDIFNKNNRNNSFMKSQKLVDISNENERLRNLLRKIPKHDKKIFSITENPIFNNYNSTKRNKSLYKPYGSIKTKFNLFSNDDNNIKGYNNKKYNSIVMPPNDFGNVAKTMSNINL